MKFSGVAMLSACVGAPLAEAFAPSVRRCAAAVTRRTTTVSPSFVRKNNLLCMSTKATADGGGGRASLAASDSDLQRKTGSGKGGGGAKLPKLETGPVKGTRDFYPEDLALRTFLFDKFRASSRTFGFREYDAPVLEHEDLYVRKAGEEVSGQLYSFEDKGGRRVALRPEMTPSLARMVMARGKGAVMPIKWFSIPQCWRYERMTRGRRREHYQWNVDIWGVPGVEAEAELLATMVHLFTSLGLTSVDVGIKINSRAVVGEVLTGLGVPADKFAATCVLVDKLEKVPLDAVQGDMEALGLDRSVVERLTSVLSSGSLDAMEEVLGPSSVALADLRQVFTLAENYGISDWLDFDASVVRGLAYYTGAVFEAFDRRGELRAVAGGGRYDKLLETFGGAPTPACGFGFGDAVIVELLKERGLLPPELKDGPDAVVFAVDGDLYGAGIGAATALRAAGASVDVVLEKKKAKWVFKHADRIGAKYVFIIGKDEYERGEVSVKDLGNGEQELVAMDNLAEWWTGVEKD